MAAIAESSPMWMRLGEEDREKYGGPEWVIFDAARLYNTPSSELEAIETAMPVSLNYIIRNLLTFTSLSTRGALFVARWEAGVQENWNDFDPMTIQVQRRETDPHLSASNGAPPKTSPGKPRGGSATLKPGLKVEASPPS